MQSKYILLLILALFLASCANEPAEPLPTPLPTAVYPDAVDDGFGAWAISFAYEFPENFWPAGVHRYAYRLECPPDITQLSFSGNWNTFSVSDQVGFSPDPVYLRLSGLSLDSFAPLLIPEGTVHPQQDTIAIIHFLGIPKQVAERAAEECTAFIAWDEALPQQLTPIEIFQP